MPYRDDKFLWIGQLLERSYEEVKSCGVIDVNSQFLVNENVSMMTYGSQA